MGLTVKVAMKKKSEGENEPCFCLERGENRLREWQVHRAFGGGGSVWSVQKCRRNVLEDDKEGSIMQVPVGCSQAFTREFGKSVTGPL